MYQTANLYEAPDHLGLDEGPKMLFALQLYQLELYNAIGCSLHVFFGFMRASEFVVPSDSDFNPSCHLATGGVLEDNQTSPIYLVVNVKASKTDRPL